MSSSRSNLRHSDARFTHQCPACLLLTEGAKLCRGDLYPSIFDSHTPCWTIERFAMVREDDDA